MILLTFNILKPENLKTDGIKFSDEEMYKIIAQNTNAVLRILENHDVKATFFIEISIAENNAEFLKKIISKGHEVAFYNKGSSVKETENAKTFVEKFLEKPVRGIRQKDTGLTVEEIKSLEFTYISKIENSNLLFPIRRLQRTTEIIEIQGVSIVPESISPYLQLPYNDFIFQMVPMQYYQNMVFESVKNSEFVQIYLDINQFTDFQQVKLRIPFYRKYNSGKKMEDKLEEFLSFINKKELAVSRMKDYII